MMDTERLTSASGPTEGYIKRADSSDVKKIAIINPQLTLLQILTATAKPTLKSINKAQIQTSLMSELFQPKRFLSGS